jgi:DNA-directed RNA polymerase subunit F
MNQKLVELARKVDQVNPKQKEDIKSIYKTQRRLT